MSTKIKENSFAEACYNENSIAELKAASTNSPDKTDMLVWDLTEEEWRRNIILALSALLEDNE